MISVCIPVYNYPVVPLAQALSVQAKAAKESVELVFIDDCSSDEYREKNSSLEEYGTFIKLEENVGRARIRNLFLEYAKGEYLLFLDNDSIVKEGFLDRYVALLPDKPSAVVGGRVYDRHSDKPECHLRYIYGVQVESTVASQRKAHPYRSFMTNNFLIHREILESIRFDERLTQYGHEDTVFGYRLEQQKVPIVHIDNPVVNGEVETNHVFLEKTKQAIHNLTLLYRYMAGDARFVESVRLLQFYSRVRKAGFMPCIYHIYRLLRRPLVSHFETGEAISVRQFNFYKLGLFIEELHYQKHQKLTT